MISCNTPYNRNVERNGCCVEDVSERRSTFSRWRRTFSSGSTHGRRPAAGMPLLEYVECATCSVAGPCSCSSVGRVESSSGPTGVWLPEAHALEGTRIPLRGAAGPVRFKSLSQLHCPLRALWFSPALRCGSSGWPFRLGMPGSPKIAALANANQVRHRCSAGTLAAISPWRRGPSRRCHFGPFARRHQHSCVTTVRACH